MITQLQITKNKAILAIRALRFFLLTTLKHIDF